MTARLRRLGLPVAALVAMLVVSLSGAEAQQAASTRTPSAGTVAQIQRKLAAGQSLTSEEKKYGISAPRLGSGGIHDDIVYDAVQDGTTAIASTAKTSVALPQSVILTYARACLRFQGYPNSKRGSLPFFQQLCCPLVNGSAPKEPDLGNCNPDYIVRTPRTTSDQKPQDPDAANVLGWTRIDGKVWAVSPKGASRPYGEFPPVKIQLLAFGSVPASATVHLSQPVAANGQVEPLRYFDLELNSGAPDGTRIAGLSRPISSDELTVWTRTLQGTVNVRLSNVEIDGIPLDVGPSCRTKTPASIDYKGPRGSVSVGLASSDVPGRPNEFDPLNGPAPGVGHGSIAIPSFSGCRDGARSLDPLVTALASGPSNPLTLRLSTGSFDCTRDDNPLKGCPAYPGYDGPVISPPNRLAGARAALSRETSSVGSVRRALAQMPAARRKAVSKSLPAALQAELTRSDR